MAIPREIIVTLLVIAGPSLFLRYGASALRRFRTKNNTLRYKESSRTAALRLAIFLVAFTLSTLVGTAWRPVNVFSRFGIRVGAPTSLIEKRLLPGSIDLPLIPILQSKSGRALYLHWGRKVAVNVIVNWKLVTSQGSRDPHDIIIFQLFTLPMRGIQYFIAATAIGLLTMSNGRIQHRNAFGWTLSIAFAIEAALLCDIPRLPLDSQSAKWQDNLVPMSSASLFDTLHILRYLMFSTLIAIAYLLKPAAFSQNQLLAHSLQEISQKQAATLTMVRLGSLQQMATMLDPKSRAASNKFWMKSAEEFDQAEKNEVIQRIATEMGLNKGGKEYQEMEQWIVKALEDVRRRSPVRAQNNVEPPPSEVQVEGKPEIKAEETLEVNVESTAVEIKAEEVELVAGEPIKAEVVEMPEVQQAVEHT